VSSPQPPRRLATTRWSLVLRAGDAAAPARGQALSELCETYWYPLYAYLRRDGCDEDQARDLTQGFFAEVLEKNVIAAADPERGRFRAFLFTALRNYAHKERRKERAAKRGGTSTILSFDVDQAEARYRLEPVDALTPERIFERRWAMTLVGRALEAVRAESVAKGKGEQFDRLCPCLTGSLGTTYAELAAELGIREGSVKVAVHRLRQRFRRRLTEAIAHTVSEPGELEQELRHLTEVLSRDA
jgi:RNA polymerase sigma-70 factor (ECF subfamily)